MNRSALRLPAFAVLACLAFAAHADAPADPINNETFGCIRDMTPVRGFYVGSLNGNLDTTVAAANAADGAVYPEGSVVQLVPTEVMVKRAAGFNPATKDWEFFELDVAKDGSAIRARGFADVNNRFGGNCFACHAQARPEWDMICEQTHGCAAIPLTADMTRALQKTDPRCEATTLTDTETTALQALMAAMNPPPVPAPAPAAAPVSAPAPAQ